MYLAVDWASHMEMACIVIKCLHIVRETNKDSVPLSV